MKFDLQKLTTTSGDTVHIYNFGQYNTDGGADFLNGKVEINGTVWYGNIEVDSALYAVLAPDFEALNGRI